MLEELRLLGNLESRTAKAVFVVLVAQPGLRDRLTAGEAAGFGQRVGARPRLEPLTAADSEAYLAGQVRAAGARGEVFTADARGVLAGACGGVPRRLSQAAALALELAMAADADEVDVEAAVDALGQLGLTIQDAADELPNSGLDPARRQSA